MIRRLLFALALVSALALTLTAQSRFRFVGSAGSSQSVITESDFSYLGAYTVPRTAATGETFNAGWGLALRREASDVGNEVHLLAASYRATGSSQKVYEWRDRTPTTGGVDPYDIGNYTDATIVKEYGDIYSGKKLHIYDGVEGEFTQELDGDFGMCWDSVDSRLYYNWGFGYSSSNALDVDSWHFGYATLDYAGGTGTGNGPWRLSGQAWKSAMGGCVVAPTAYANAYLGGKRIVFGVGGYYSIHATAASSMGPSLTAVDAALGTEKTALANVPLVGYWPYSANDGGGTSGRANRPEDALLNATSTYNLDPGWAASKMLWNDRVDGACWIDTPTKRGVLFVGQYGRGYTEYVNGNMYSTRFGHFWAIYDPNQFTPVSGTARYNVQPTRNVTVQYPTINYNLVGYAGGATQTITAITSSAAAMNTDGNATVTVPGHGFTGSLLAQITGANRAEYNAMWVGTVTDADHFTIYNSSRGGLNWSGVAISGTATLTASAAETYGLLTSPGADAEVTTGCARDEITGKVYIGVTKFQGVNNGSGKLTIHVYQGPVS